MKIEHNVGNKVISFHSSDYQGDFEVKIIYDSSIFQLQLNTENEEAHININKEELKKIRAIINTVLKEV